MRAMKSRKECGSRAVLIPNSEPDRFEFHNGIVNHNAPNCKNIELNNFLKFHFVIILPCYPGYTLSALHVTFSDQTKCAILSSPVRAVYVPSITCQGWKRHVTNTTTLKVVITSVLFVNYS